MAGWPNPPRSASRSEVGTEDTARPVRPAIARWLRVHPVSENLLPIEPYLARMRRAVAYIEAHLDEAPSLDQLSALTGVSKYHFHRQFSAIFGIGVARFAQLLRLKRASMQLLFHDDRVLDVALANGYGSHEAFARAFKSAMGQTPSAFRAEPDWPQWHQCFEEPLNQVRRRTMKNDLVVTIETFPETATAELMHVGPQHLVIQSVRTFIAWRKAVGFTPAQSRTFNLLYDDAREVPPEDYRFGLAVSRGTRSVPDNAHGIVEATIPGGRVAKVDHVGSDAEMFATVGRLYADWLPRSGETLRDAPLVIERLDVASGKPEHASRCCIYMPLQ